MVVAILSGKLVSSDAVPVQIFPNMSEAQIVAQISMNKNSSDDHLTGIMERLEASFNTVRDGIKLPLDEMGKPVKIIKNYASFITGQDVFMIVELETEVLSLIPVDVMIARWQEVLGPMPSAKKIKFSASENGDPNILSLKIFGHNDQAIRTNIEKLKQEVLSLSGIFNYTITAGTIQSEYLIKLLPEGQRLGLTMSEVTQQVAAAFQGERLDRLPGRFQTTDVILRLPKSERLQIEDIDQFPIGISGNNRVPFSTVAELISVPVSSYIERINAKQTASVDIHFNKEIWNRFDLLNEVENSVIPAIKETNPSFDYQLSGDAEEEDEFTAEALRLYILCSFIIYALLAIGSNSYFVPFIILTAAPFGFVGAIYGHYWFSLEISAFSIMGVIAAAGVVINDNLVLVDRINQLKATAMRTRTAVRHACISRFRPIILTSLTTFLGLLPILFEGSYQAQFVIPMAISLAFGVLIATFVTLLLVPVLYEISLDINALFKSGDNLKIRSDRNAPEYFTEETN